MACGLVVATAVVGQPIDQDQLVERLRSTNYAEKRSAVAEIQKIPPAQRNTAVLTALATEIDLYWVEMARRAAARRNGTDVAHLEDHGQYAFELVEALSQVDNPLALPPLLKAIGTGNRAIDAIARFGEVAVPRVIDIARGESSDTTAALFVLARMLDRPVRHALSPPSVLAISEVARTRMAGTQRTGVVGGAIELALATGDPELLEAVHEIAAGVQLPMTLVDGGSAALVQNWAKLALQRRQLR